MGKIFSFCGHSHHRILKPPKKFYPNDYEKFNRFFKDKNLFKNYFADRILDHVTGRRNREHEIVLDFKNHSHICLNINKAFFSSLQEKLADLDQIVDHIENSVSKSEEINLEFDDGDSQNQEAWVNQEVGQYRSELLSRAG